MQRLVGKLVFGLLELFLVDAAAAASGLRSGTHRCHLVQLDQETCHGYVRFRHQRVHVEDVTVLIRKDGTSRVAQVSLAGHLR